MKIIFKIDKVQDYCFIQCQTTIYKYIKQDFYCKSNIKFPKRMKLEHKKTKKILHWVDRQGVKNDIEEMTNQHIENSLRFFFENNLWRNRKHMMKFLMMEKRRRIRFGTWNLAMARLGRFGENGRKEMANFLNEMVNI